MFPDRNCAGNGFGPGVDDPIQDGLVIDDVVAGRREPIAVGIPELRVVVEGSHAVGQKKELLPPVVGLIGRPDEERLAPVVRAFGIAVEGFAGVILVSLADEVLVGGVGQAGAAADFGNASSRGRGRVVARGQIIVADRGRARCAGGREGRSRRSAAAVGIEIVDQRRNAADGNGDIAIADPGIRARALDRGPGGKGGAVNAPLRKDGVRVVGRVLHVAQVRFAVPEVGLVVHRARESRARSPRRGAGRRRGRGLTLSEVRPKIREKKLETPGVTVT